MLLISRRYLLRTHSSYWPAAWLCLPGQDLLQFTKEEVMCQSRWGLSRLVGGGAESRFRRRGLIILRCTCVGNPNYSNTRSTFTLEGRGCNCFLWYNKSPPLLHEKTDLTASQSVRRCTIHLIVKPTLRKSNQLDKCKLCSRSSIYWTTWASRLDSNLNRPRQRSWRRFWLCLLSCTGYIHTVIRS